jgi:hypothetical protein
MRPEAYLSKSRKSTFMRVCEGKDQKYLVLFLSRGTIKRGKRAGAQSSSSSSFSVLRRGDSRDLSLFAKS